MAGRGTSLMEVKSRRFQVFEQGFDLEATFIVMTGFVSQIQVCQQEKGLWVSFFQPIHHYCRPWPSNSPSPKSTTRHPAGQIGAIILSKSVCISSEKCPFSPFLTTQATGIANPRHRTESIKVVLAEPVWLPSMTNTSSPLAAKPCKKWRTKGR